MPFGVRCEWITFHLFPLRIELYQVFGNLIHRTFYLGLGFTPLLTAQFVDLWLLPFCTDVALDHIQLLHRNEELVVFVVGDFYVIPDKARGLQLLDPKKNTNTMIHMNHIIAFSQLSEALNL